MIFPAAGIPPEGKKRKRNPGPVASGGIAKETLVSNVCGFPVQFGVQQEQLEVSGLSIGA